VGEGVGSKGTAINNAKKAEKKAEMG